MTQRPPLITASTSIVVRFETRLLLFLLKVIIMYRRSLIALSKQTGRTIVRDPRKKSKRVPAVRPEDPSQVEQVPPPLPMQQPLPFQPSNQNQESLGSTMASYALAGVGVTLGFTLVRVLIGF
jgi:hypothetical protein